MSTVSKFKSFGFTVRPKNGLKTDLEDALRKWILKQPYYAYNVEMEDEAKHLHAQVWYDEPKSKGDLTKALFRIQSRYDDDWGNASKKVLSSGVKIAYNDKFMEYMSKDSPLIEDCPPDCTDDFYPSEEEQLAVQEKCNAVDTRFHKFLIMFKESTWYSEEDALMDGSHIMGKARVADWYFDAMFVSKTIPVVQDNKVRCQVITSLYYYCYGGQGRYDLLSKDDREKLREYLECKNSV